MRHVLTFLIIISFYSCREKGKSTKTIQREISNDSINNSDNFKANQITKRQTRELTTLEWVKHEDSLRNVILKSKENKILKESFLQEMYIRNVVSVSKDSLFVTIPFNLHGPDCGAPDCYSTDVDFSFKLDDTLVFPEILQFQEHEHGCVDKEIKQSGSFQLVEKTDKHVIYHSAKHKRTLVLFSIQENGTFAFYFTGVEQNRINGKNLYNIMKDCFAEDIKSICPFTSWVMTTNEYEFFLH